MSNIEIRERDMKAFFQAPYNAYGEDSLFVSQMKADIKRFLSLKNPLFRSEEDYTYFTAHRDGKAIGRIVVHVHVASNAKYGTKRCSFGYFDVADDFEAAQTLIYKAEDWAKARGFDELMGNYNLTAMQQMGVMIGGFENQPYIDFIWNQPHVAKFLDQLGYTRDFYMTTFEVNVDRVDIDRLLSSKAKALLENDDYKFIRLKKRKMKSLLEEIRLVLNDGFSTNPFFVPLTPEEMAFQAKDLSMIMDERITALIHYKSEPVGTVVCIPDLNPFLRATKSKISLSTPFHYLKSLKNRDRALLIFASVNKTQQNSGLTSAMLAHIIKALRDAGYKKLGITWAWDENPPVHVLMEKMNAEKHHRLCMFKKTLKRWNLK